MKDPRAVEILHIQNAEKDEIVVQGYWDGEVKQGGFIYMQDAQNWAKKNGFIVCIRPQKKQA